MMKKTGQRILSVLIAAALLCACLPFAAFAADGDEHKHVFQKTVYSPGYINGGYTVFICECGYSYIDNTTSPIEQPYCTLTGGTVAPGGSITVTALLKNCSGLNDLTLDLFYNTQWLHLTDAACAEYGAPERLTDRALRFDSINAAAQRAYLRLTFSVDENAPTGSQTVSISGCGVSSYTVDNGEEIFLTTVQSAKVTVYRPFTLTVNAPEEPVLTGRTVQVTVDLSDNPGVAGMALALFYDPDVLTLTGAQANGMLESGSTVMSGDLSMIPYCILWDDATAREDHTESGTILTLNFAVKDTAQTGTTQVLVTFNADDILNSQLEPIELLAHSAQLLIDKRIPGDADDDGDTDLMDTVLLSRYLAGGWDVQIEAGNCDVNGDGMINLKDVVLIRRYLADGWDVVLV